MLFIKHHRICKTNLRYLKRSYSLSIKLTLFKICSPHSLQLKKSPSSHHPFCLSRCYTHNDKTENRIQTRKPCRISNCMNETISCKNIKIFEFQKIKVTCVNAILPLKCQPHKMGKHSQTIRRQFADELFKYA